ncbi:hypothetical protein Tco_1289262 [Tanacetum coccineum]
MNNNNNITIVLVLSGGVWSPSLVLEVSGGGVGYSSCSFLVLVGFRGDVVGPFKAFGGLSLMSFNLSSATSSLPDCLLRRALLVVYAQGVAAGVYPPISHPLGLFLGFFPLVITLLICNVLELITEGWSVMDCISTLEKLSFVAQGGPVSVDVDFGSALVMKRVSKTIGLLDAVAKINDPQCELLLIRACAGVSKLYFTMRTCPPRVFESAQLSFVMALVLALERYMSGLRLGVWGLAVETRYFTLCIWGGLDLFSRMLLFLYRLEDGPCGNLKGGINTSDWLRVVPISGLGQTMNVDGRSGCFVFGVRIWTGTGSSPLTQTGMSDFAPGRAVTDAAQRKRGKYMTKCADNGYGFLPFSFSSFGELEKDAVTLLKRVRNFSMAQDIGARAASHIFNRIGFSIAKGVGAQIVSRLPSNVL